MKITIAFVFLVFLAPAAVLAKPANSCSRQADCIDITTEQLTNGLTCDSGCEYKICLLIQKGGSCVKSDSWSHSCVKPEDQCSGGSGFSGALEKTSGVSAGYEQCQIVTAGNSAEFLLKDGGSCGNSASLGDATCEPRDSSSSSCTGNGIGKECVWTIPAPINCRAGGSSDGDGNSSDGDGDSSDGDGDSSDGDGNSSDGSGDSSDGDGDSSDGDGDSSDGEEEDELCE